MADNLGRLWRCQGTAREGELFNRGKQKSGRAVINRKDFLGGSGSKESACSLGDLGSIPGRKDPLEQEMEAHSRILAWEIPWREELGGYQSVGLQRIGHD